MPDPLLFGFGALLLLVVSADFIATTMTLTGGGLVSRLAVAGSWRLVLRLVGWRSRLARLAGPVTMLVLAAWWIAGIWTAWFLIFLSGQPSVVDLRGRPVEDWGQILGYVGSALSTMGASTAAPASSFWEVLAMLAAINGMAALTLSVSFVLGLVGTVIDAGGLALTIHALGRDAEDIVIAGWDGAGFAPLASRLDPLGPAIARFSVALAAFPLALLFTIGHGQRHLPQALVTLGRVVLLLEAVVAEKVRPHRFILAPLAAALGDLTGARPGGSERLRFDLDRLATAGIPLAAEAERAHAHEPHVHRHRRMIAWARRHAGDPAAWREHAGDPDGGSAVSHRRS